MKYFSTIFFVSLTFVIYTQDLPLKPSDFIKQQQVEGVQFEPLDLFRLSASSWRSEDFPDELRDHEMLQIQTSSIQRILKEDIPHFRLSLPSQKRNSITILLKEVELGELYITEAPSGKQIKMPEIKHFRGIVEGKENSMVAISISQGGVMGLISDGEDSDNLVIGRYHDSEEHIIYRDGEVMKYLGLECHTQSEGIAFEVDEIRPGLQERSQKKCVRMYLEVDYDIFTSKGGMNGTTQYITGLYNQVATLYANDQISTVLSGLVIWSKSSPYNSTTSSDMLTAFGNYRTSFNGDIAMLLSYKASGGIAWLNTLCQSNSKYRMGFSSISKNYSNVPTYSWSVMVVAHEFGHILGSEHTHACVWNGNGTAIDGCNNTQGSCTKPGIPSNGGTIMSYCHLTSAGINLNNGFGPQPGNLIRNRISSASCLQTCSNPGSGGSGNCSDGIQNGQETGIDCGGPDCQPCPTGKNTRLFGHYFEKGWDGWVRGGTNCTRYYGSRSPEGKYSIRLRGLANKASRMVSPAFDSRPYHTLSIQFQFYTVGLSTGEGFQIFINHGSGYKLVAAPTIGTQFRNSTFYTATLQIPASTFGTSASSLLLFRSNGSSTSDHVYVDAIVVEGLSGQASLIQEEMVIEEAGSLLEIIDEDPFTIFPNPASQSVQFSYSQQYDADMENAVIQFRDITGKLMRQYIMPTTEVSHFRADVSDFPEGTYLVHLHTPKGPLHVKKLIVVK